MNTEIGYQTNPDRPARDEAEEDDKEALAKRVDELVKDYAVDYCKVRDAFETVLENGAELHIDLASAYVAWQAAPDVASDEYAAILHRLMRELEHQIEPELKGMAEDAAIRERRIAEEL